MNPQTVLCDELAFIGKNGLDARGFFLQSYYSKNISPLLGYSAVKKSVDDLSLILKSAVLRIGCSTRRVLFTAEKDEGNVRREMGGF